jgi:hypothetical protein
VLPSYRAMLDREGYAGPDAAIIGDEATVKDRLAELRAPGVDEYVGATFVTRGARSHPRGAASAGRVTAKKTLV